MALFVCGVFLFIFSVVPLALARFARSPRSRRLCRHPRLIAAAGLFCWALYLTGRLLDAPALAFSSVGAAVILFLAALILGEPE